MDHLSGKVFLTVEESGEPHEDQGGSYGLVGNDALDSQHFFYVSDVNLNGGGNYAYFGTENGYQRSGVYINSYENRDVTWETSRQANLGMELSMLKGLDII